MGQFVSVDVIGTSAEGRNLSVVKICQGGCGKKPIIFIEAGDGLTVSKDNIFNRSRTNLTVSKHKYLTVPRSNKSNRS